MNDINEPQRIVVFRNGSIGNTLAAIPAVKCLRESFPQARISIVVDAIGNELLTNIAYIDAMIVYDRRKGEHGVAEFLRTVRALRKERPDTAVLFKRFFRNGLLARLSGASRRVGFVTDGKAPFLTDTIPYDESVHVADLNLRLVRHLGATANVTAIPEVALTAAEEKNALRWLAEKGVLNTFIVAHFGGTTSGAAFVPLATRIQLLHSLDQGKPILLVGNGAVEAREAQDLLNAIPHAVSAVGESLRMTIALIAQASGFIGTNSGPMHIAAAARIPGIALFKQDERLAVELVKWRPLFTNLRVVPVAPGAMPSDVVTAAISVWQTT